MAVVSFKQNYFLWEGENGKQNSKNHTKSVVEFQAEQATRYYVSIFENSIIDDISYYGKEGFEIHGMKQFHLLSIVSHRKK
ncbi:hypothetical protein [Virgibacillus sp. JSM 102003]|uniref:hypothetical protein n=1 Tax=Virgibacillus sp. JSM 102003 TaxID=1562108 RepID=UPI0035C10ADD